MQQRSTSRPLPESNILIIGKMESEPNGQCTRNEDDDREGNSTSVKTDEEFERVPMVTMKSIDNNLLPPESHTESPENKEDSEDVHEEDSKSRCQFYHDFQRTFKSFCEKHSSKFSSFFKFLTVVLLVLYFCYAMYYSFGDEGSITLLGIFAIVVIYFAHKHLMKFLEKRNRERILPLACTSGRKLCYYRWFLYIAMVVFSVTFIVIEVGMKQPRNLISLAGMVAFLLMCVVASTNVTTINWHCIFWSVSVQFLFALILLRTEWGISGIEWVASCVEAFMEHGYKASKFVFGKTEHHRILLESLPLLCLVNSFIAILYHLGFMQILIKGVGKFLSCTLGTTTPESLSVSANMFLGSSQSVLIVKPYLNTMSKSELFSMMVGGFASVSGAVFGIFIHFGAPSKHLLTACIMSAPASFAISKLLVPESKKNRNKDWESAELEIQKYKNLIDATGRGALEAVAVCSCVLVNLYVFYALLQFINSVFLWTGERIGVQGFSFQFVISYFLLPIPMLMGVDLVDCRGVAKLIGYKLVGTNGLAFIMLGKLRENKEEFLEYTLNANRTWHYKGDDIILDSWNSTLTDGIISDRSTAIATYAMCGFSNFASMGIMMGTLFALAPKRQELLVKIILKAMIAGNIACYLTACIAGVFYET